MSLLPHSLPENISKWIGESVARTHASPNLLTLIGLCGTAGAASLAAFGYFWQAALAMLLAGIFDLLDGAVARATNRASNFGAILDAVCDRLADFSILIALLVWFSSNETFDREAIILIGVTIGGSMLVPYTRSKAGEFGVQIREGLGTRFERIVILAIGMFTNEIIATLWILALLTNFTILHRLGITWWALRGNNHQN